MIPTCLTKKDVMKRLMFMLFFVVWGAYVFSQVRLTGRVTDEKGDPLPGANVVLVGTYLGDVTDGQGYFLFRKIQPGDYRLRISFVGYETREESLHLAGDQEIRVQLTPSSVLTDEVVVSGVRASAETPVTYTNISAQQLSRKNLGQDIPYLIKTVPSIVVSSDAGAGVGYTSFRIRGTDLTRINVTMNGIPLNDSESHGVWWVDLPDLSSSVADLQVQRGVGTSTNGAGAFGASVNIRTFALQSKPYVDLSSSAGSFKTFKNTLQAGTGLINDRFTLDARVSRITSDGYIDRAYSRLHSLALTGAWYSKKKDIIRLVLMDGFEKTYQAWDGVPKDSLKTNRRYNGIGRYTDVYGNVRYYDNETDNYMQDHYQIFYSKEFSRSVYMNLAGFYTKGKGYYEQYKEDQELGDYLLNDVILGNDTVSTTDLIRQKWLDNDFYGLIYNLKVKKERWDLNLGGGWNRYNGGHYGKVIWARYFSNGEKGHRWYDNRGIKEDFNLYGKVNYRLFPAVKLYLDLQVRQIAYRMEGLDDDQRDLTQRHHYTFFNPKGGFAWGLSDRVSLYISYAIAHREPSRYDFKEAPEEGPVPRPEMLRDLEAGTQWSAGVVTVHANMYYMDYKDQLVMTGKINNVGVPIMTNVPKSSRLGLEFQALADISGRVSWEGNLTLSRNKIRNFTEYVDDWDTWTQRSFYLGTTDLSFSPGITANSILKARLFKPLEVRWLARYIGKQYIDNTSSEERKLDPYFVNDLLFSYDIRSRVLKKFRITAMINNLFNARYETNAWVYQYYEGDERKEMNGYFPQAGIHFMAGINLRF